MTVDSVESVLGINFDDFEKLLIFLQRIGGEEYGKYLEEYKTIEDEHKDEYECKIEEKEIHHGGVEFRIWRMPHCSDTGKIIFGFVVSHESYYDAVEGWNGSGSKMDFDDVLEKAEVLKELSENEIDALIPAFYTVPDGCWCCT